MKIPDLSLTPPEFQDNPEATAQLAAYTAKLTDILRDIYQNLGTIPVVSSAPVVTQLQETSDNKGEIRSEVKILDSATQSDRKLYYRFNSNLRLIDSA